MDWKDLFYFSKSERNGIIVLLVLIVMVLFAPAVYRIVKPLHEQDFSEFEKAVIEFEALMKENEARQAAEKDTRPSAGAKTFSKAETTLNPFPFDPNELSAEEWQLMGVAPHVAQSIENYRKAGGVFRYKEDFSRMYLVDKELYEALLPFIKLPSKVVANESQGRAIRPEHNTDEIIIAEPQPLLIDLNLADSLDLLRLKGIGPVFSRRIIAYRESLGGFCSTRQLMEVFGMDSTRMEGIVAHVAADTSAIRKIDINKADFEELLSHPYIGYNVANSIIALRNMHGPFPSIGHIRQSQLIDEDLYLKLLPYLTTTPLQTPVQP